MAGALFAQLLTLPPHVHTLWHDFAVSPTIGPACISSPYDFMFGQVTCFGKQAKVKVSVPVLSLDLKKQYLCFFLCLFPVLLLLVWEEHAGSTPGPRRRMKDTWNGSKASDRAQLQSADTRCVCKLKWDLQSHPAKPRSIGRPLANT